MFDLNSQRNNQSYWSPNFQFTEFHQGIFVFFQFYQRAHAIITLQYFSGTSFITNRSFEVNEQLEATLLGFIN